MKITHQELIEQLRRQIQRREVEISALQEKLSIRFLDKILFDPGNAVITSTGRQALKNVGEELKKLSDVQISVEGHTDDQPLSEASRAVYHDNLGLSVARAAAVARTLRAMGVDPNRLSVAGYSMYRSIATNNTDEGRGQNRRVEIILSPIR
jgi:chemotaxis protein MotB